MLNKATRREFCPAPYTAIAESLREDGDQSKIGSTIMSLGESKLQIVGKGEGWLKVQQRQGGNTTIVEDTFAEMYHHSVTASSVVCFRSFLR